MCLGNYKYVMKTYKNSWTAYKPNQNIKVLQGKEFRMN